MSKKENKEAPQDVDELDETELDQVAGGFHPESMDIGLNPTIQKEAKVYLQKLINASWILEANSNLTVAAYYHSDPDE